MQRGMVVVEVTQTDYDAVKVFQQRFLTEGASETTILREVFAAHRIAALTTAQAAAQEHRIAGLIVDDPDWICAGIPDAVIEAGMAVQDKVRHDLDNYIAGETPDWDDGMICAAIFKAMLRAALGEQQ